MLAIREQHFGSVRNATLKTIPACKKERKDLMCWKNGTGKLLKIVQLSKSIVRNTMITAISHASPKMDRNLYTELIRSAKDAYHTIANHLPQNNSAFSKYQDTKMDKT